MVQLPEGSSLIPEMEMFESVSISDWLDPSSISWVIEIILAILCGVVLFLLLLPCLHCLQGSPSSPPSSKPRNRKHQTEARGRNKKRKKREIVKACRDCLKELEETRNLILQLQSQQGMHHDKRDFHQPLVQDHHDEVHKVAPAGSRRPCMEHADDDVSPISPSTSPALPNEHPLPLTSTFPQDPKISLSSTSSQSSTNASGQPEPLFIPGENLEHLSSQPPEPLESGTSPPPPPVSSSPPPTESTLTLHRCDSVALPQYTFPRSSSPHNPWPVSSIPAISGTGHASGPISPLTCWQKASKTLCISTSSHRESQEGHLSCDSPRTLSCGDSRDRQTENHSLSLLSSDDKELLETQITKRVEIRVWNEKEDGSYSKQMSPDYHLNYLGNIFKTLGAKFKELSAKQNNKTPQPFWCTEGQSEQLPGSQQFSCPKALGDQLFWGLPSLHSESLVTTAWISESSSSLSSPSFLFNGTMNACPDQMQAKIPRLLSQSQSLCHLEFQSQPSISTISQFQSLPQATIQTKVPFQSFLQTLTPSSPQIRDCEMSCSEVQNQPQSIIPSEIQHLEWSLLQKQVERGWIFSTIIKRSQEMFNVFSSNLCKENWAVSILPKNLPISPELRKQLEQHLQNWLIQHRWELPQRIQESLELKQLQCELPKTSQARGAYGLSQSSLFTGESSKETKKVGFQLSKDLHRNPGHSRGEVMHDNSIRSGVSLVKVWKTNLEESDSDLGTSSSDSGSEVISCIDENVKHILKRHLSKKLGQIREDSIPVNVQRSWVAVTHVFPKSKKYKEKRNLRVSEGCEPCGNTSNKTAFPNPCAQELLGAHIVKIRVKHMWRLPLKVLKCINIFKLKEKTQTLPFMQSSSSPSATCIPGVHSRVQFAMVQEESLQAHLEKKTTEESDVTQERALLTPSTVYDLGGISSSSNHESRPVEISSNVSSELFMTGQETKLSSHSFTADHRVRTWQNETMKWSSARQETRDCESQDSGSKVNIPEMNLGFQSLRAQGTSEVLEVRKPSALQPLSRDILRSNVLTKSQTINGHIKNLASPVIKKRPVIPRMIVSQDSGESRLHTRVASKCMFKTEVKSEEQSTDYPTYMFPIEGDLVPWVPHCHLQSVPSGEEMIAPVLCGCIADQRSSLQNQEFRCLKLQPSQKRQSTATDPYKRKGCYTFNYGKNEGSEKFQTSQFGSRCQPTPVRTTNSLRDKCQQKQVPQENFFRKGVRLFLQWVSSNKKSKGQDQPQKCKPALIPQRQKSGKSKSIVNGESGEAQELMTAVGRILEDKMALTQATKLNNHKQERQPLACGSFCSHRPPCHAGKERKNYTTCNHQAILQNQNSSTKKKQDKQQRPLKSVRFNDEPELRYVPAVNHEKTVSPVSAHQYVPSKLASPGCYHHCPRHCVLQGGAFPGQREPSRLTVSQSRPSL